MKKGVTMKTIYAIGIAAALTAAAAREALADVWQQISGTYNPKTETSEVRIERGSDNTYGFISLYGDTQGDGETYFGKVCATAPVGHGIGLGGEATTGTGVDDLVRGMATKNFSVGPAGGQVQVSPASTESVQSGKLDPHAGLVLYGGKGRVGLNAWGNVDDAADGDIDYSGEVTGCIDLGKGISGIVRVDGYPWQEGPSYAVGVQLKL
jgi:hypothetical protein